jgi:hypothetical protein
VNPLGTVKDGRTRMPSVANQQVAAVMPLWRAAEIVGLNPAPVLGEPRARDVDLSRGALR